MKLKKIMHYLKWAFLYQAKPFIHENQTIIPGYLAEKRFILKN